MSESTAISRNLFYQAYDRRAQGAQLKSKHLRQFDRDFVAAAGFTPSMSVLEMGCGNGLFLRYLDAVGARDFVGVDGDPRVLGEMPPALAEKVRIADFADFFANHDGRRFDRVVLFDVLEHFDAEGAVWLLSSIAGLLADGGRIVVRTPNMASPFGLGVQYNDVTHLSCFTPGSLRQVGKVAGLDVVCFRPQAYGSWYREARERLLTGVLSWFMAAPPMIWTPNLIAVYEKAKG